MYYFYYLRARKRLIVFSSIAGSIVLLNIILLPFSHVGQSDFTVGVSSQSSGLSFGGIAQLHRLLQTIRIPFVILVTIAAALAAIFGSAAAASLSGQNRHLHFDLTRPASRRRLALTTFGMDGLGIAASLVVALALLLVPFAILGALDRLDFSSESFFVVAFGLGIAYMWYGLLQAVTVRMRGGGGAAVGISWAVFVTLSALHNLPASFVGAPVVWIIHALNIFNPIVYLGKLFAPGYGPNGVTGPAPGSIENLITVWIIALVALAIAVVQRERMEV
jgi:hypothetical protein